MSVKERNAMGYIYPTWIFYLLCFLIVAFNTPLVLSFPNVSRRRADGIPTSSDVRRRQSSLTRQGLLSFIPGGSPLDEGLIEDERMPSRLSSAILDRKDYRSEWGVSHEAETSFPCTVETVVDHAFLAIAGTLNNKQAMDPNQASNARSKSIFDYRPTRSERDAGRIGVEIDGASYLFQNHHLVSPERALRRVALLLAAKLSMESSWAGFENQDGLKKTRQQNKNRSSRPVAVYFNTIKQALAASQEIQLLKRAEAMENRDGHEAQSFDNVKIQYLSDGIPEEMLLDRSQRRRYRGLTVGYVDPTRGLILIVQPTDYNSEYRPPGPAVGAVGSFQRLVAQASVEELPVVTISPRFLSNDAPFDGWDQSGYQKSAIYGGKEPPKGPTPWVMRDFTPPVFCWVANAMSLRRPKPEGSSDADGGGYFSRVALMQSIMDVGHCWNIFAVKECLDGKEQRQTKYHYLASTQSASGRPTKELIRKLLNDL